MEATLKGSKSRIELKGRHSIAILVVHSSCKSRIELKVLPGEAPSTITIVVNLG